MNHCVLLNKTLELMGDELIQLGVGGGVRGWGGGHTNVRRTNSFA